MMTSHVLENALLDSRLGVVLSRITPTHALDVIASALLAALSLAYLFPKWTWDRPDPHGFIYFERPQSDEGAGSSSSTTRNIAKRLEELVDQHTLITLRSCLTDSRRKRMSWSSGAPSPAHRKGSLDG